MEARTEIKAFSEIMEQKLKENDHKSHWSKADIDYLLKRLNEEVTELENKFLKLETRNTRALADDSMGDIFMPEPEDIQRECADVANFAMMIADNIQKLSYASIPQKPISDEEIEKAAIEALGGDKGVESDIFRQGDRGKWCAGARWAISQMKTKGKEEEKKKGTGVCAVNTCTQKKTGYYYCEKHTKMVDR